MRVYVLVLAFVLLAEFCLHSDLTRGQGGGASSGHSSRCGWDISRDRDARQRETGTEAFVGESGCICCLETGLLWFSSPFPHGGELSGENSATVVLNRMKRELRRGEEDFEMPHQPSRLL